MAIYTKKLISVFWSLIWRCYAIYIFGGILFAIGSYWIFSHYFERTEIIIKLQPTLRAAFIAAIFVVFATWRSLAKLLQLERNSQLKSVNWRRVFTLCAAWMLLFGAAAGLLAATATTEVWLIFAVRIGPIPLFCVLIFALAYWYTKPMRILDEHATTRPH
jgi:intracellular septation protein A